MDKYLEFQITGHLEKDVEKYFLKFDQGFVWEHTLDVVNELIYIENYFGHIEPGSLTACYCHDLGRVVKEEDILDFCRINNISVLEEEKVIPSILHQRIACFLAQRVFGINDEVILNAVNYHSTSRHKPSMTEIEVYLSDKMSWKEEGYKEQALKLKEELRKSKEAAMLFMLRDLYSNRGSLRLYHKDSREAYEYFMLNL